MSKKESNPKPPSNPNRILGTVTATTEQICAAFTEWDRRYREDPEAFENEATRLLKKTPKDYGEACTPYFCQILREVKIKE